MKAHHLKMFLLLKIVIFHCHVGFQGLALPKWMESLPVVPQEAVAEVSRREKL